MKRAASCGVFLRIVLRRLVATFLVFFEDAPGRFAVRFEVRFEVARFRAGFAAAFLTAVRLDFGDSFLFFFVAIHAVYHRTTVLLVPHDKQLRKYQPTRWYAAMNRHRKKSDLKVMENL